MDSGRADLGNKITKDNSKNFKCITLFKVLTHLTKLPQEYLPPQYKIHLNKHICNGVPKP